MTFETDTTESPIATATAGHDTPAQPIPPLAYARVPAALVAAALTCVGRDESRYYTRGVYLHRAQDGVRIVATDGQRLFVGAHAAGADALPSWLEGGAIIPADGLRARLALLASSALINIGFAAGAPRIELADAGYETVFRVRPIDGAYPDYEAIIRREIGPLDLGEAGELRPTAFVGAQLKGVADTARALGAEAIHLFTPAAGGEEQDRRAALVTFAGAPNAVLYVVPARGDKHPIGEGAATILAPALKSSVAALRAHRTRLLQAAKDATDTAARTALEARASAYDARIAAILAQSNAALPAPAQPEAAEAPAPTTNAVPKRATAAAKKPAPTKGASGKAKPKGGGFDAWRRQAEIVLHARHNVDFGALPDVPLRDWYDAGVTPKVAATRAYQYAH